MSENSTAPELLVITLPDADYPDRVVYLAECPHCGARGLEIIREVDRAERHNYGDLTIENGAIVAATWGCGQTDFRHHAYICDHCEGAVSLPDDVSESWN